MRWTVLAACFLSLGLLAGCYNPQVKNGGFACSMTDNPPCPNGFFCVNGLCEDQPGASSSNADLATGTGGNGGGGGTGGGAGGGGGGGTTTFDMAHAPVDMSGADMAQAPMCGAQLDSCSANSDCCNMVCFPGGAGSVCLL